MLWNASKGAGRHNSSQKLSPSAIREQLRFQLDDEAKATKLWRDTEHLVRLTDSERPATLIQSI